MAQKTLDEMTNMNPQEKMLYRDYSEDLEQHDGAIEDYDAYEAMDMGKTYDPVSRKSGNGLTDNMTATIYLERAARVAGQPLDGQTMAVGKKDYGKGMFYDLLRKKWMYPNANAQFDFMTKMFIWQYGSSEYNVMPMHYDINIDPIDGKQYLDCWLYNPRNVIPQSGFTSVTDMDYLHALSDKSPQWFQDILDDDEDDEFDKEAIQSVITQIKNGTKEVDPKRDTLSYREKLKQSTRKTVVATRYESGKDGRWISFLPDYGCKVIRNIKNPHKNGRIPFVIKRCIPKLDSYYGNGDFQRSMPMQFANDGLDNFYFQGIKVNLFPALMVNMQTAVRHTISQDPGSIMEFNGTPDAKRLETSTAGLSTYQAAKGMAKGAIQSIAGTTDTRSNKENSSDPGFGKTPEALKQIKEREGTRDNFDRGMLEKAMAELVEGWYSIMPTISEDIPVDLFSKEIEEIMQQGYDDLGDIFKHWRETGNADISFSESGNQMKLKLKPEAFKNIRAKFQYEPNSTAKQTREQQLEALQQFWLLVGKMPNALQQYQEATGKVPDWEYIFGQMGKLMELPFMDKMFTQATQPPAGQMPTTPGGQEAPVPPAPGATPQPTPPAPTGAEGGVPPQQGQPDPQVMAIIQQASPERPVRVGEHQFTDPQLAMQAYAMALQAGIA